MGLILESAKHGGKGSEANMGKSVSANAILGKITSRHPAAIAEGLMLLPKNSEAAEKVIGKSEKYSDTVLREAIKAIVISDSGRHFAFATQADDERIRRIAIMLFSRKPNTEFILYSIPQTSTYSTSLYAAESLFELEKLGSYLAAQMLNTLFREAEDSAVHEYIFQMVRTKAIKEMLKSGKPGVRGTGIKALGANILAARNVALHPPDEKAGTEAAKILVKRLFTYSKIIADGRFSLLDEFEKFPVFAALENSRVALLEISQNAKFESARREAEKTLQLIPPPAPNGQQ